MVLNSKTGEVLDALDRLRARVVHVARAEMATRNPNVSGWWALIGNGGTCPKHWCGIFALYCLRKALPVVKEPWINGKGFVEHWQNGKLVHRPLPLVQAPLPGDVVIWRRAAHHALCWREPDQGMFWTLDGNQGRDGATTGDDIFKEKHIRLRHPGIYGIYSIEPWLLAEVERENAMKMNGTQTGG